MNDMARPSCRTGWRVVGVTMCVVAVATAGCGDDDDVTAASVTAAVRRTDFIARGDEILCAKSTAVAEATASVIGTAEPTEAELLDLVLEGVLPAVQRAHDDLAALAVPLGDEAAIAAIIEEMQAAIDATASDPGLLLGDDDPFAHADELISAYGLSGCPT